MDRKIIIYVIILLSLFSCDKYFETEPLGKVTEQQFYKNVNDFQDALYAAYAVLKEKDFQYSMALLGDGISDDFIYQFSQQSGYFGIDGYKMEQFNINADNEWVKKWYQENYKGIYRTNQLLSHIEDSITITYTPKDESSIIMWRHIYGQALFLRAYYYFNLVKAFGDVPIQPVKAVVGNTTFPRSSKDSVYAYIEKDLRTAAFVLHESPGDAANGSLGANNAMHYNEPSKFTALALLMKVNIYQAKPGVPSEKWREAKKIGALLFNKILGKGGIDLTFDDVLKLSVNFKETTWDQLKLRFKFDKSNNVNLKNELNKPDGKGTFLTALYSNQKSFYVWHQIFRVAFQNDINNNQVLFCAPAMTVAVYNPNDYPVTTYVDALYGIRYEDVGADPLIPTTSLKAEMQLESGDPRNWYGIATHFVAPLPYMPKDFNEQFFGGVGSENLQIFLKHWLITGSERPSDINASPRNLLLMRYNDYALFYAEALNECGDPINAIDIINKMRLYMINNDTPNDSKINSNFTTQLPYGPYEVARERIWHERRIELCGEYDRYWDILRQGRAADILNGSNVEPNFTTEKSGLKYIKGIHELMPIPQVEIELSHGVIQQNPGY
jgi:starch-binding outer membrane protein, SusD/RagB family